MKPLIFAFALLLTATSAVHASSITYSFSETAGAQAAQGTITTDGMTGVLSQSDISAFSLSLMNGMVTNVVTSLNGGTVILRGSDLTASASFLTFNFGGTDNGGLAFYDSTVSNFLCIAQQYVCLPPTLVDNIVIGVNSTYTQVNTAATKQVIASVPTTITVTPEPSSLVLLATGALGAFASLRRRAFSR